MSIANMLDKTVVVTTTTRTTDTGIGSWIESTVTLYPAMPVHIRPLRGDETQMAAQRGVRATHKMYHLQDGIITDYAVTDTGANVTYDIVLVQPRTGGIMNLYETLIEERNYPVST